MGPETMGNSILVVDDNPVNLKLLSTLLQDLDLKVFVARHGASALALAQRLEPDLILLDVMMPEMDGFEVCRRLKADPQTQAIRVIFVTALADVEQKVRGFEVGGADYIAKPFQEAEVVARVQNQLRLRQLTQDLEQEIEIRRQREASLQRSESRFRMLIDALPFGVWMRDANDRLVMQNPVDKARFGNQIGSDLADLALTPEELDHYHKAKKRVTMGQVSCYETTEVLQGQPHSFLRLTAPVPDESGGYAIVGVAIDVTEQQQAVAQLRESEQRFRRAIAEAPVPIMIHAEDGEVLQLSSTWTELSGYRHEDIPTVQTWLEQAYGKPAAETIAQTVAQDYHLECRREEGEFTVNTADGQQRIWNFTSAPLGTLPDGRRIAITMASDVTEQQQAQAALSASEGRYRALVEVIPDLMIRQDAEGQYLDLVLSDEIQFIRPELTRIGASVYEILPLALAEQRMAYVHRALQTGEVQIYDFQIEIAGNLRWQEARITAIAPAEALVIVRDISDRKQAELALRESEQRFRRAISDAPVPIMIHAEDGEVLQISSTWTELSGYTHADMPTTSAWAERAYGDQATSVMANTISKVYDLTSRRETGDFTVNTADGQQRIWSFSSAPLGKLPDGRRIVIAMAADVTDSRRTQAALQASERRYRALVEVIPDLMIRQDAQGNYLDLVVSPEFELFKPNQTHIGRSIYDLLPLDLAEQRMAYVQQALQTGEVQIYDFQIELEGKPHWEEARVIAINEAEALVIVRDIHERKQASTQLHYTSQRLQEAQRIAKLGNWELHLQTGALHWSDEIFHIFEIDRQQFGASYEAFLEVIHPDDRNAVNEAYTKHLQDGIPYSIVHRLLMPDGRIKYVQEQCATKHDVDGTAIASRGTVLDITTLKEAEQKRLEAEASLRQIVEGTAAVTERDFFQELVQHISRACEVRYVSISESTETGFAVLAFSADGQLQGEDDFAVTYEEAPCCLQALQDGLCHHPDSLRTLYPDNQLFRTLKAESYLGIGLRNSEGEPIGDLCIIHDRPLANADGKINLLRIFAARASAELERYQTARQLQALTAELEQRVIERTRTLAATVNHLQTEIQQRQTLETQLRQSQAQLQDLFDNANDMIQSVNLTDGSFEFVNQAWLDILGYTTQELGQITIFDVLHPSGLEHCMALMQRFKTGELQSLDQVEMNFLAKDGRRIQVEGSLNVGVVDGQGVSTRGIFRDVTARKQAEKNLILTKFAVDKTAMGILRVGEDGRLLEVNEAAGASVGYSPMELQNRYVWDINPDMQPDEWPRYWEDLKQNKSVKIEGFHQHKSGDIFPVEIIANYIEYEGQGFSFAQAQDISDRKQAERLLTDYNLELEQQVKEHTAALVASQAELTDYIENAATLLHWVDGNGVITWANQTELDFLGYDREDYVGQPMATFHVDDDVTADILARLLNHEALVNYEARLRCKDGSIRTVQINSNVFCRDGEFVHTRCFTTDITERKGAEMALNDLVEGTAAVGEDFFPALVSHISTALNVPVALVTQFVDQELHSLALVVDGELQPHFTCDLRATPCIELIDNYAYHCPQDLAEHFPSNPHRPRDIDSYLGVALRNRQGQVLGSLCIFDRQPLQEPQRARQILEIFGSRAAAELERQRTEAALQNLITGTAATTGADFFPVLVHHLTQALGVSHALVAEKVGNEEITLAYHADGTLVSGEAFALQGTPCEQVYEHGSYYDELDSDQTCSELARIGARSYLGVALNDRQGNHIGILCIFHRQILLDPVHAQQILTVFAARAAAELERQRAEAALQDLIAGTAALTGPDFFAALVCHIAEALQVSHAFVTEVVDGGDRLHFLAAWADGQHLPNETVDAAGTTCAVALEEGMYHCDLDVIARFPQNPKLAQMEVESYQGIALQDRQGNAIGTLCVFSRQPIVNPERSGQILRVFGARAAVELERQRVEQAMEQLNQELEWRVQDRTAQFRRITENVPGVIYRYVQHGDRSHEVTYISAQVRTIFELEPEVVLQNAAHLWERIHPDDIAQFNGAIQRSAETLQPLRSESRLCLPQKGLRWIQTIARPERLDNGDVVWDGVVLDISDRKVIEAERYNLSTRLSLAVKSGGIGIWEWDFITETLTWDERMYELYGVSRDVFKGRFSDWSSRVHPEDLQEVEAQFQIAIAEHKELDAEFRITDADGQVRHLKSNGLIERNQQGQAKRMIGINFDISDRKIIEAEIIKTLEHERQLGAMKSRFVSIASHEFRTPLAVISSNAELLKLFGDQLKEKEKQDCLDTILSYVDHATELVSEVLVINKAESGTLELNLSPVDIVELSHKIGHEIALSSPEHHYEFAIVDSRPDHQSNTNHTQIDKKILRQTLTNLLTNAIKYSPEGSRVQFNLTLLSDAVEFNITDEGIGIPEAELDQLFEPFQRASNVGNVAGTGLGLSIVKHLVTTHQGYLNVTSTLGEGSCFSVTLPVQWR